MSQRPRRSPTVTSTAAAAPPGAGRAPVRAELDVLVIGGGITGVGVALDAASRGLSVALVEAQDLAFGTSRWSSKLVHGGLRYLASGDVGYRVRERPGARRTHAHDRAAPGPPAAVPGALQRRHHLARPAARCRPAPAPPRCCGWPRAPIPGTLPGPRRVGAAEARSWAPPCAPTSPAGCSSGTASSRTTPGWWSPSRARRPRTARGSSPGCARVSADGRSAPAARRADRRGARRQGPGGGQRDRRLGRRSWPGRTPTAARSRRCGRRRAPTSCCARRRSASPRPAMMMAVPGEQDHFVFALPHPDGLVIVGLTDDPVSQRSTMSRCAEHGRDRLPARHRVALAGPQPVTDAMRWSARSRACGRSSPPAPRTRRHAPPTSRAATWSTRSTERGRHGRRRQAHHLPADGRGHRRLPRPDRRRLPHPLAAAGRGRGPRRAWRSSTRPAGWCAATAPRRRPSPRSPPRIRQLAAPLAPGVRVLGAEVVWALRAEGALTRRRRAGATHPAQPGGRGCAGRARRRDRTLRALRPGVAGRASHPPAPPEQRAPASAVAFDKPAARRTEDQPRIVVRALRAARRGRPAACARSAAGWRSTARRRAPARPRGPHPRSRRARWWHREAPTAATDGAPPSPSPHPGPSPAAAPPAGSPASRAASPTPGSSAMKTASAAPPSGAGPQQATAVARAPGALVARPADRADAPAGRQRLRHPDRHRRGRP